MAWKETHVPDERVNFVREVEAGDESIAALCRVYGVSRKTGYKWWARYEQEGVAGLADRPRAPLSHPNAVGADEQAAILALRARWPNWGERKLHAFLQRERPAQAWPSPSTIGAILKRHGLTYARRRRRHATPSSTLSDATAPNLVWAIDFKGHFRTGDGVRCDPLTISDTASPPRATARGQQRAFQRFQRDYNEQRPHEALGMATPASVYVPSPREYPARLEEIEYPSRYQLRRVAERGDIHWRNRVVFLSEVLAGETVGLEEDEQGWRIWFGPILLTRLEREQLERARRTGARTRPRVPAACLGRDSGRPTGSLRRAQNTASGEATEKGASPGET